MKAFIYKHETTINNSLYFYVKLRHICHILF